VGGILRDTGINPALIKLELTESMLMKDARTAVDTLHQLKFLGVQLSVDDFGTGYSSLAYLKRFPLDELKIDREFISDAINNPDDATITLSIINLAHSLKLSVVAEGVETEGQFNFLRVNGCDEIQGYYFSPPLPVGECTRMLAEDLHLLEQPQHRDAAESVIDTPALLLVADNADELQRLTQIFKPAGYRIATARNSQDGFEVLARQQMDIVISDNDMPGMSGIEFLTRTRKLYPETLRVLASSGDDTPTLTRATNNAGIHLFLPKIWAAERLCAEVREILEARGEPATIGGRLRPLARSGSA
jgi:CheY-like chemotaxis protein